MDRWPRALLFDFDGVIVNSEPLHLEGFRQVLAEENIQITEAEYYRELIGFDDRGAFAHIFQLRQRKLNPEHFVRLLARKSEAVEDMIRSRRYSALPGVDPFIRKAARNYPLAICSGALREEIESMLQGIGLRECFKVIVSAEDVTLGKPDPQGYLLTTRLLAEQTKTTLTPQDVLVIEDAPSVIRSVKTAGFRTLGVATSYPAAELGDADYVTQSLHREAVQRLIPDLMLE